MREITPRQALQRSAPGIPSLYAWYVLGVMVLVYALSMVDRQILSILAEEIKGDLNLTDTQIGYLYGTAFAIFYTVFGLPLGRLADNWSRLRLMAIGLALWSFMTMASGLASSFAMLAITRIGVGIGEASASPAAFSVLAGTFPKERRGLAIAIYNSGGYLGLALSLPIGALLSHAWDGAFSPGMAPLGLDGWQAAFIGVGAPGLLIALWVMSLREPRRVAADGTPLPMVRPGAWSLFGQDLLAIVPPFTILAASRHPGGLVRNLRAVGVIFVVCGGLALLTGDHVQWATYGVGVYAIASWALTLRQVDYPVHRLILCNPTLLMAMVGIGCSTLPLATFSLWGAPYAIRTFHVAATEVGPWIGLPGAAFAAIGVICGGYLGDRWKQRDPRGRIFVCLLSSAFTIPLMLIIFTRADLQSYLVFSPLLFFFGSLQTASAITALQDMVLPRMYGTIGAGYLVGQTMIAICLGPYFSGKIATFTGSLQAGMLWTVVSSGIAIVLLTWVSRRVAHVEENKLTWAIEAGELCKY